MEISELANEKYSAFIVRELKAYGVKYHKEKKKKYTKEKDSFGKIFCTHLHLLDLADVILANGKTVKIPDFLKVACGRVLEQVDTEGLFRKAGSVVRQREIRTSLENGEQLGKHHHVIDVANVIKYFFRELPLPLISPCVQEALLQCLLVRENSMESMLLACLLLPLLTINTLSFFLQFLLTVSLNESRNKMTVQNLAIVFTPALMPFPNIKSQRYMNHVKIVRLLIENANSIGIIPAHIERKLLESTRNLSSVETLNNAKRRSRNNIDETNGPVLASSKKKRRSDLFHGLRKMVGSTMGSTELLDCSFEGNKTKLSAPLNNHGHQTEAKKSVKEGKKRKFLEPDSMFKSKKKDAKKTRLSFGAEQNKNNCFVPVPISVERRWSIVGSTCSKYKNKNAPNKKCSDGGDTITSSNSSNKDVSDDKSDSQLRRISPYSINRKCEYAEIKEKGSAMEHHNGKHPLSQNVTFVVETRTPDHGKAQFEPTSTETELLESPSTEQLAQCLNRKLHVRKSANQCVTRSKNYRKTEKIRYSPEDSIRKSSWHIQLLHSSPRNAKFVSAVAIQLKSPDSLNTSISEPQLAKKYNLENSLSSVKYTEDLHEKWLPGEEFFSKAQAKKSTFPENENSSNLFATPSRHKINFGTDKTPMLPPKTLPIKVSNITTPLGSGRKPATATKLSAFRSTAASTPDVEDINGRASIARLREQNAGMVMAKAKLFDSLETRTSNQESKSMGKNSAKTKDKVKSGNLLKCDAKVLENSQSCKNDLILSEKYSLQPTVITERAQRSASNTPVSASKQRNRNVSKLPSQYIIRSTVPQDRLTKKHGNLNFENGRQITKTEQLKTTNSCRNPKSPRRPKK